MNKDCNIAFFGCKNITKTCMINFQDQLSIINHLITISPSSADSNNVSGYMDLTEFAQKNNINTYVAENYSLKTNKDIEYLKSLQIDVAFVIGWQRLIPEKILNNVRIGIFGMHGSAANLPKGRGRSPMNWSLILGEKRFYTNK